MKKGIRLFIILLPVAWMCFGSTGRVTDQPLAVQPDGTGQSLVSSTPDKPEMESVSGSATVNLALSKNLHSLLHAKGYNLYTSSIPVQYKKPFQTQTEFSTKHYLRYLYPTHNFW